MISRVQNSASTVIGTSGVVAFSTSTTSGNCVVVGIASRTGVTSVVSVTDSAGNTYTPIVGTLSTSSAGNLFNQFWAAKNITGGFTLITVTTLSGASFVVFRSEYSGVSKTTPTGIVGALNDQSGSPYLSPSLSIVFATSALVALMNNNGVNVTGVGAPWVFVDAVDLQATADLVPGVGGVYQASFTLAGSNLWCSSGLELLAPSSADSMFLVF